MRSTLIALTLLLSASANAQQVSGNWGAILNAKSSSANPRCASMTVTLSVDAAGNGTFELAPQNSTTRVPGSFKLEADGSFNATAHTPVGAKPFYGVLTAVGGRVDYDNPTGCAYGGKVGRQ